MTTDDEDENNDVTSAMNFKNRRDITAFVVVQTEDNNSRDSNRIIKPRPNSNSGSWSIDCRLFESRSETVDWRWRESVKLNFAPTLDEIIE